MLFIALLLVFAGPAPVRAQVSVQQVSVELTFDGAAPHPIIRDRIAATVASVAQRLLVGRPVDQLAALQPRPEDTIATVVDRVATGYAATEVAVHPGVTTVVAMRVRPVGTVIGAVAVFPDLRTVHASVQPLLTAALQGAPLGEMQATLVGLPVDALDWAGLLVDRHLREVVEAALPGFTAAVRLRPGDVAQVGLIITPRDSRIIRNIGVRFRSTSIPIVLLDQHGPQVASMAEVLRGLPVAYAEAARRLLEQLINEELTAYPPTGQYQVVATARLDVAETTYVTVTAESLTYRARVEARLNIGTSAPGPEVVGHLGRLVAPAVEPFVEVRLVPTPLALAADVGLRYEVSPTSSVGATYAPSTQETTLWTTVQFSRDVGIRGEWTLPTQVFEGVVVYRINEFLAWELIGTSQGDIWVSLVSNL